jgi:hypothetical protein
MRKIILSLIVLLTMFPGLEAQESVTLEPSKDNTIYTEATSNGKGDYLFSGRNNRANGRRALVYFDLKDTIPADALIDSVSLTMAVTKGKLSSATPVKVHRLTKAWGEGLSKASNEEGQGGIAGSGDATWIDTEFDTQSWSTPGGDFESNESSVIMISPSLGPVTWSGSGLMEDVKLWLADENKNHGWILIGDEGLAQSVKRFASRENSNDGDRPALTIYYSEEPAYVPGLKGSGQALNAYPNPFIDQINITYQIGNKENVQLGVYNLLGQQIEIISRGLQSPGRYHVKWDGTDRSGKAVPNGMYYIILDIGKNKQVTKIMKTR